jgi:hypothetical protein
MIATLTFYRNFLIPCSAISAIGFSFQFASGSPYFVTITFWMKVITNVLLGLYVHFFKSETLVFYHNLGLTRQQLYGGAFILDIGIWLLGSVAIINFLS